MRYSCSRLSFGSDVRGINTAANGSKTDTAHASDLSSQQPAVFRCPRCAVKARFVARGLSHVPAVTKPGNQGRIMPCRARYRVTCWTYTSTSKSIRRLVSYIRPAAFSRSLTSHLVLQYKHNLSGLHHQHLKVPPAGVAYENRFRPQTPLPPAKA